MLSETGQNLKKAGFPILRFGFPVLVFASISALILTFLISVVELSFAVKLSVFSAITTVYLILAGIIYRFQYPPALISFPEISADSPETVSENVFSPEVEEKLLALEEANTIFSSSLKPADMFRLVSNRIIEIIPFSTSALYLLDKNKDKLKIAYAFGKSASTFTEVEIEPNAGIAGKATQTHQIQTDRMLMLEKSILPPETLQYLKSAVACPLVRETDVYGVLVLYDEENRDFDAKTIKLLEAVGERIAPLFLSSITFENNLNSALIDSLTNLPNQRALFMILENQVAESQRSREQRPLTVLSVDIKDFAGLNGKYGHSTGDRVLSFAAKNIKEQLRQMDFLCRVAGDEFLAVLPTSSDITTAMIIERIEKTFAANPFDIADREKIYIKLNFGFASFIRDGETAQDLLKIAGIKKREAKSAVKSSVLWFPKEYSN